MKKKRKKGSQLVANTNKSKARRNDTLKNKETESN